jgi:hypothetical protein
MSRGPVTHTLHIDSRDREYDAFPSPHTYRLALPRTYYNVTEARLLTAEIPSSFYVFEASRGVTSLRIRVGGIPTDIIVPDGNYTNSSIASMLTTFLNAAYLGKTFVVAVDQATMKLVIRCSSNPTISIDVDTTVYCDDTKVTGWGLGYYLGFDPMTVRSSSGTMVSPRVVSLNPQTYLVLDIAELNNADEIGQRGAFAKIPFDTNSFGYAFYDAIAQGTPPIAQVPTIPRLDRLTISFRFHDGSPINFNDVEHSFTLSITTTDPIDTAATPVPTLTPTPTIVEDPDTPIVVRETYTNPHRRRLRNSPTPVVPPANKKRKYYVWGGVLVFIAVLVWYYYNGL